MKNIKIKYTLLYWLKIGYCNWEYYKDRKQICYKGKPILFDWSEEFHRYITLMTQDLTGVNNVICKKS